MPSVIKNRATGMARASSRMEEETMKDKSGFDKVLKFAKEAM